MLRFLYFVALVTAGMLAGGEGTFNRNRTLNRAANLQKAIRFVGMGYNLLEANPDATGGGGVDPGFLTKRRVVDLDPSGREAFLRYSCVTRSSTYTIYDEKSFQKKFDLDVAVDASMSYLLVTAKFALSTGFSEARDLTTKQRKMTLENQTLCNLGGARMKTELDVNRASQEFQAEVCRLPDTYDQGAYVRFINDWGTSFVMEVDVGIRNLTRKTETFSSVFEKMRNALAVGASVSAGYNSALVSVGGSMEMNMNMVESSDMFSEFFKGEETTKMIGTREYPEPIYVKVGSLHTLVTAAYFGSHNPSACTSAQLALLSTKQAHLARALDEYPEARQAHVSSSDGKVRIPLTWPRGTYGLLKSTHGCPEGWAADGQRTWNTEDDRNANKVTPDHHFAGYINSNIQLKFCVKTNASMSPQNEMDWPAGEYCIYKFRECPKGFTEGSIFHDDENREPSINSVYGTVPDGKYDLDTRMYFCCRSDSHNNVPIFLPTDKPFYLFQATKYGCQEVEGMLLRRETIYWDDENYQNRNSKTGAVPWNNDPTQNWHLFICYYFKDESSDAETTEETGTQYYPEPIYVEVDSLFPLVTAAYLSSQNPSARTNAQLALLSTKELYLARALSISDAKVRIPLTWPRGTYGLLKSTHGCPDGWAADGQRTWNTEDDRNANKVTPDHHFDGYINSNIQLKFCVKTNSSTSPQNEMDWPAGKYCIYKFGECPNGFTEGSIFHDDEDQKPSNNSVSGTVPDGKYDLDTRMYFCCRSDGHNNDPIFLPTDKPFYLFQAAKDGCQEVKGMLSRRETILWDDENAGNLNYKTGAVPWNDDSTNDWHLFMCYYFKYFTYRDGSWYT